MDNFISRFVFGFVCSYFKVCNGHSVGEDPDRQLQSLNE